MNREIPWPKGAASPTWASCKVSQFGNDAPRVTVDDLYRIVEEVERGNATAGAIARLTNLTARQVDVGLQQLRKAGVLQFVRATRQWVRA